jgi:CHAT domain-containing protein
VYLVPGDHGTGAAVIVPAHGDAQQVMLPWLHRAHMPDLASVALPGARRDLRARGVTSLDDVCGWAWKAVVEPVLRRVPGTGGRPPRLALVPMRELAAVPWHAARTIEDGRTVRAVERAAFSYVPSARLLCATAVAAPVPLDDRGLFVGDPDTGGHAADLPAARIEAWAVRQRFYPAATYVGRTGDGDVGPDGPGRPKDVLDWLGGSSGGTVLHLACHAVVDPASAVDDPDPGQANDTAYLLLSDGERLAAEHITAGRAVGLVVLGACNSGVAARGGHDEAFSLAATFLAAGARTVVSSLWSVPDDATSALMYLFHHHLRAGLAPIDALRSAQLWMLDPDRRAPDDMPGPMRARLAGTEPSDVDAWAGFFHIGR